MLLNCGNDKSAFKPEMNTFDQDVLKHHQYFKILVEKKKHNRLHPPRQLPKIGGNGSRKEVH